MDEFALIRHHFAQLGPPSAACAIGVGDDCALLLPSAQQQLAVSTDTLVAGRHFHADADAADVGWKALAVNVSDLAAMGATPLGFTLAMTLPEAQEVWLTGFATGLNAMAHAANIPLVGGDTTCGPLSITITVLGQVPSGAALLRSGARAGDFIAVSGTLGDAALALERWQVDRQAADDARVTYLRQRLYRPTPRLALGCALRGIASAAIDISDGLAGDLAHVLNASYCGAVLEAECLPRSAAFAALLGDRDPLALQLHGGDDYELCMCVPPVHWAAALDLARALGVGLSRIGTVTTEQGQWLMREGRAYALPPHGYRHFA